MMSNSKVFGHRNVVFVFVFLFVLMMFYHFRSLSSTLKCITIERRLLNDGVSTNGQLFGLYSDVTIYIVTPTYKRPTQMPDLTRMEQTLRHVPNILWILVEEVNKTAKFVGDLLERTPVPHIHLIAPYQNTTQGRGFTNRKTAFEWIRAQFAGSDQKGVIYLADDDNSYDIRVFEEMRDTRKISMFPVGCIADYGVSSPVVSKETGKIIAFHDSYGITYGRRYAVDMAGFAVNLQYFLSKPNAEMKNAWAGGLEETFLRSLEVPIEELEPKARNCTQVLVWHTRTQKAPELNLTNMAKVEQVENTNLPILYEIMM